MALVASLFNTTKDRQKAHKPVEGAYSVYPERKSKDETSQTLQFNENSGRALMKLLKDIFPD
jgi:hypothetical protein